MKSFECLRLFRLFASALLCCAASPCLRASPATVAAGGEHACAVVDGGARCWGDNQFGQLGNPAFGDTATATDVVGLLPGTNAGVTAVAAGRLHTCVLVHDGVSCWGRNTTGAVGAAVGDRFDKAVPTVALPPGSHATSIATGGYHSCAVIDGGSAGTVRCWGDNGYGQLGRGNDVDDDAATAPQLVPNLIGVAAIAAGLLHTCALMTTGSVSCWGFNEDGALGLGDVEGDRFAPDTVPGLTDVSAIALGDYHSCAIVGSGAAATLHCWGYNAHGQLGFSGDSSASPVLVPSLLGVTTVAAGDAHTCAQAFGVHCWGQNDFGQLGNGLTQNISTPTQVVGLTDVDGDAVLAAGQSHSCARLLGLLYCWGRVGDGQIGNASDRREPVPKKLILPSPQSGTKTSTSIAVGTSHSCAIVGGNTQCWGANTFGQLGIGNRLSSAAAVNVPNTGTASAGPAAIAVGDGHSCAIVGGGVRCWGSNANGQLGHGDIVDHLSPVAAAVPGTVAALASGATHSCALTTQGTVYCWGDNLFGQLGLGSNSLRFTTPQLVPGLSGVTAIAAGGQHTCALVAASLYCWGRNDERELGLGANAATKYTSPALVIDAAQPVSAIAAGASHTCAVADGVVQCWGRNVDGQLGIGSLLGPVATPVEVIGLPGGIDVLATGTRHSCAIVQGGLACWGSGGDGQLGIGQLDDHDSFVTTRPWPAAPNAAVSAIAMGYSHSCAVIAGDIWCWGDGSDGKLGTLTPQLIPVPVLVLANDVLFAGRFEFKP